MAFKHQLILWAAVMLAVGGQCEALRILMDGVVTPQGVFEGGYLKDMHAQLPKGEAKELRRHPRGPAGV
uniref:Uncharacterized protein n=1 Tax=Aegilops tauschii TaxID=37682 RepID=M8CMC3_AEGTA